VTGTDTDRHASLWRWNKGEERPEPFEVSDT